MKTTIYTWIGRIIVVSFVFGMCGLGLVKGQPHKSTSLGLVCQSVKDCDGARCEDGQIYVTCQNCIGISNDALWRNPCPQCGRSRKVRVVDGKCQKCQGSGKLPFGPRFQVADADFPELMNWYDAKAACRTLGGGWRLPTKEELTGMYEFLHRKGKGNFQDDSYWSSSNGDSGDAWSVFFQLSGVYGLGTKNDDSRVRAVRALP